MKYVISCKASGNISWSLTYKKKTVFKIGGGEIINIDMDNKMVLSNIYGIDDKTAKTILKHIILIVERTKDVNMLIVEKIKDKK